MVGYTFVGVPGVQHFAHAGEVAWAITNACADYQDVTADDGSDVVEQHTETIQVLGADAVEIDVVETARGLVFEDGLAVRTSSWELGELGFDAILGLLRARTADDVDRALDSWVEPVNNAVIADRAGAVRYRIAGRVPVRDGSGALGRLARGAEPRRDPRRRPRGHGQRAARARVRGDRHRVRGAVPGRPAARPPGRPHRPDP